MDFYLKQVENELRLRNYSPKTVKSYVYCLRCYFDFAGGELYFVNVGFIKKFLLSLYEKKYSSQTVNLHLNAIKFFYRHVLKSSEKVDISCARRTQRLPVVLSHSQVLKIINSLKNPKHKLIISISYGAGLRVSEVVNLKVEDINFERLIIHIRHGKGNKDRISVLPKKLLSDLKIFCSDIQPNLHLFRSHRGGKLTTRTVQKVFTNALKKTAIKQPATFHSLRHSFATHLLENGVDICHIQKLLGHANIKTTQLYTRVTMSQLRKIESPL